MPRSGTMKAAPLAGPRLVMRRSTAGYSAVRSVRTADAEAVAMLAGAAAARDERRAAAAHRVAGHTGSAALRDLRGEAVGLNRRNRHGLCGTKAERRDKSSSDQALHECSLLWVCWVCPRRRLFCNSDRGVPTIQSNTERR